VNFAARPPLDGLTPTCGPLAAAAVASSAAAARTSVMTPRLIAV
jgi:hypothetical protein